MTDANPSDQKASDRLVERIEPKLADLKKELEANRRSAIRRLAVTAAVTVAAAIAVSIVMTLTLDTGASMLGIVPIFIGGVVIIRMILRQQEQWRAQVAGALLPRICEQFEGDMEYQAEADRNFVKPYTALDLVGRWTSGEVQHLIRGKYRGRQFEMVYAHLRAGSNRQGAGQVFQGLLLRIQTMASFEPGLSIRPNFGLFVKAFGKRAVPTGDEKFDSLFLVSPDDNSKLDTEQLNRLFPPEWQQALLAIHEDLGPVPISGQSRLSAGAKYDALYLAIGLEELGPMRSLRSRPFPDAGNVLTGSSALPEMVRKTVDDVLVGPRAIDRLPEVGTNPVD